MNKRRQLFLFLIVALLISLLCTGVLYFLFPRFLCCPVYSTSESNLYQGEEMEVEGAAELKEFFVPLNNYIKEIAIHIRKDSEEQMSRIAGTASAVLTDSKDHIAARDRVRLEEGGFILFDIESWVKPGQKYQLQLTLENCENVYLAAGSKDIGPEEHDFLLKNGQETEKCIYIRYIYGCYTKKLLALWFLTFFCAACVLLCGSRRFAAGIARNERRNENV